ncbi:MAG: hypothetical protein JWQ58_1233 [Reyranella sp.]|nr:hypothetical protein [Reyranella sp.]
MIPRIAARITALFLTLALAACASPPQSANEKLKPMVGASEAALVAGMGRAPDATVQTAEPGVRVLQWQRDKNYAVPNALLFYQYAGGTTRPIANSPFGIVDGCITEWTVKNGVATGYRWSGFDCP